MPDYEFDIVDTHDAVEDPAPRPEFLDDAHGKAHPRIDSFRHVRDVGRRAAEATAMSNESATPARSRKSEPRSVPHMRPTTPG
ncbi:hypothetical protein OHA59_17075 [Streptomyces sp. NBC_01589]|uniref:hypothetical protein n=1 Tax=Streptomyces sp. NBC_01589 TaxID=2975886 RepID=UPI003867F718